MHAKNSIRLTAMHSGRLTAVHSGRRNGSKILHELELLTCSLASGSLAVSTKTSVKVQSCFSYPLSLPCTNHVSTTG